MSYLENRTGKTYTNLNFWSKSLPMLNEFYLSFYLSQCLSKGKKKVKTVPLDLSLLTPLALAHWVMQKGLLYNNSLHICTDGYAEIQRLTQYIKQKFNIKCTISRRKL
jgi:hypothetical protein